MQYPQPLGRLGRQCIKPALMEEAINVTNRTELHRQRQQMRQRIRATVTARRIAAATALASALADEPPSTEEPAS